MILADIYEAYRADHRFDHLRTTGVVLVPGEGSSRPNVFIVGEAPGAMENVHKRPFVGASGVVLRSLIKDVAGLDPTAYFITNVVKYRPPNNRTPEPQEVDASLPYLRQEYAALGSPAVLVAVGGVAFDALWPTHWARLGGILKMAGKPQQLPNGKALWPMIHPSHVLKKPKESAERKRLEALLEQHWEQFGIWYREEFK